MESPEQLILLTREGLTSIATALAGSLGVYLVARFNAKRREPADLLRDSALLRQEFRSDNTELRRQNRELEGANRELEKLCADQAQEIDDLKKRLDDDPLIEPPV